jgi:hypothetical protein
MFSMYFADFVHCEAVIEISLQRMKFKEWLGFGDTVVKSYDKVIWYCFSTDYTLGRSYPTGNRGAYIYELSFFVLL